MLVAADNAVRFARAEPAGLRIELNGRAIIAEDVPETLADVITRVSSDGPQRAELILRHARDAEGMRCLADLFKSRVLFLQPALAGHVTRIYTPAPMELCTGDEATDDDVLRVSQHLIVRPWRRHWRLEAPLGRATVEATSGVLDCLHAFLMGSRLADCGTHICRSTVRTLTRAKVLLSESAIESQEALGWTPHNLYFHAKTRRGILCNFDGRSLVGRTSARRKRFSVAYSRLETLDPAVATSSSTRRFDPVIAPTLEQIGKLLKITFARLEGSSEGRSVPYPTAGGMRCMEIYIVVRACTGLRPGTYHYDPEIHALGLVAEPSAWSDSLLRDAALSLGGDAPPPIVAVLSAHFATMNQQYGDLSYALLLKNVGVIFEALYRNMSHLRLAGCALGCGDSASFSNIIGRGLESEASIGEFAIGCSPEGG